MKDLLDKADPTLKDLKKRKPEAIAKELQALIVRAENLDQEANIASEDVSGRSLAQCRGWLVA